jgi:hypothetical protein
MRSLVSRREFDLSAYLILIEVKCLFLIFDSKILIVSIHLIWWPHWSFRDTNCPPTKSVTASLVPKDQSKASNCPNLCFPCEYFRPDHGLVPASASTMLIQHMARTQYQKGGKRAIESTILFTAIRAASTWSLKSRP